MHKELDIEIYKHIADEMNVGEVYLGHQLYKFIFSKVNYTATCTEAIPFTPFDKVICQLLTIDEYLSLEEIGEILGMNVFESSNPKKYLDAAEKEILMEALQSLASPEFGRMIDGGDINFSSCKLTPTGKEYAKMKSKFKVTNNKPFEIFYDHTTGNHSNAKLNFEFIKGKVIDKSFEVKINVKDENFIKENAVMQIPEIYNPEKQNSFTNPIVVNQQDFQKEYPIALTYNTVLGTFNYYCFDDQNKRIQNSLDNWINSSDFTKNEVLSIFKSVNLGKSDEKLDSLYKDLVLEINQQSSINTAKEELLTKKYFDEYFFLNNFKELVPYDLKFDLYICLSFVSEIIFQQILEIIQSTAKIESKIFIVFPEIMTEKQEIKYNDLISIAEDSVNLFLIKKNVKNSLFILETDAESVYYESKLGKVENIAKMFYEKKAWDERGDKLKDYIKTEFSNKYALVICDEINKIIQNDLENDFVSKEQLEELYFYECKLKVFEGVGKYSETILQVLSMLESFKEESIQRFEEQLNNEFDEIELALESITEEKELLNLKKNFEKSTNQILDTESTLLIRSEKIKKDIFQKIEDFEEAKRVYPFIIDTNIFIKDPDIILKINKKHKIIIAAKVLDELDGFKINAQLKETATKIIRMISSAKNNNIHRAKANLKLLPPDFNKRSPDNLILATALMYQDKKGFLITDDKGLREKAKTVEMNVLSYDEFAEKFL